MNNKEKIKLLEEYLKENKNFPLPLELNREVGLRANRFGVQSIYGALIYIQELQREEKDKDSTEIQIKQSEILNQQMNITKILAIATIILAIGTIFEVFVIFFGTPTNKILQFAIIGILALLSVVLINILLNLFKK